MKIAAGKFKAICLKLMDTVYDTRTEVVITKHGKPIAKLVPIEKQKKRVYGTLKRSVTIRGDVIGPIDENWSADDDKE